MIQLHINTAEGERVIETMARTLEDLEAPLAAWNKYYRKKVQERFDNQGPGWPETKSGKAAPKTQEGVKQLADEMLTRKLKRDLERAAKKYARGKGSAKALARRYAVLKEFERIAAGGGAIATSFADKRLEKSVGNLRARHERATAKAQGKTLGRIASSIKSKVSETSVNVSSEIYWSGVHNDGGTAGRGAKIPKREFLAITDDDLKVLAKLIEDAVSAST